MASIIIFWVVRMFLCSMMYLNEKPKEWVRQQRLKYLAKMEAKNISRLKMAGMIQMNE